MSQNRKKVQDLTRLFENIATTNNSNQDNRTSTIAGLKAPGQSDQNSISTHAPIPRFDHDENNYQHDSFYDEDLELALALTMSLNDDGDNNNNNNTNNNDDRQSSNQQNEHAITSSTTTTMANITTNNNNDDEIETNQAHNELNTSNNVEVARSINLEINSDDDDDDDDYDDDYDEELELALVLSMSVNDQTLSPSNLPPPPQPSAPPSSPLPPPLPISLPPSASITSIANYNYIYDTSAGSTSSSGGGNTQLNEVSCLNIEIQGLCNQLSELRDQYDHDKLEWNSRLDDANRRANNNNSAHNNTDTSVTCKICLTNPIDWALLPCGHTFCGECTNQLATCPLCRQTIEGKTRIYLL
ncbi:E3 ubiquitin-protein ligase cblA-like [Oppia nitens]|uniref:E3 ubiquitin-protein ligase cblA-like n=1 Tax=Oppia nitens TaxID=1686743 RepID=UPI0023DBE694|nr:E3 ubiquitin-protein ligase cblA-like [Oppia nitens]